MEKKKLLILEDKDYLVSVIRTYLDDDFDCVVLPTKDDIEAYQGTADAAILSTNIRGAKTEELLSGLKYRFRIPILVLTSNNTSLIRIQMLEFGAEDVLTKPFNPDELKLRVLNLVKER